MSPILEAEPSPSAAGVWSRIATRRTASPPALWGSSLVASDNGTVLLFGGEVTLGLAHHRSNSLWSIDAAGGAFKAIATRGAVPAPRRQHAAAALPGGGMLVLGGQGAGGTNSMPSSSERMKKSSP